MNLIDQIPDGAAKNVNDFVPVREVRHLLTPEEREHADSQVRAIIEERVRQSALFKPATVDAMTQSILVEPTVDAVLTQGTPASRDETRRLGLGHHSRLGSHFARSVLDLRGAAAIDFVDQVFAQLQTRHRCTMLRALGARADSDTKGLYVRFHAAETSCVDSLDCDGDIYDLADLPVLPLPGCQSRQCPCSLELIALHSTPQDAKPGLFDRLLKVFRPAG